MLLVALAQPAPSPSARPPLQRFLRDGSFVLAGLHRGTYDLLVTGVGGARPEPGVAAGGTDLRLVLAPAGRLEVRVLDAGGQPLAAAQVSVERVGARPARLSLLTDDEGRAAWELPAGGVELRVVHRRAGASRSAEVVAGGVTPLEIVVEAP